MSTGALSLLKLACQFEELAPSLLPAMRAAYPPPPRPGATNSNAVDLASLQLYVQTPPVEVRELPSSKLLNTEAPRASPVAGKSSKSSNSSAISAGRVANAFTVSAEASQRCTMG